MATNFSDSGASRMCNWATGNTTVAPTLPLKVRLMTANGSGSSVGTEVVGGSYASQSATFGSSTSGSTVSNTADINFTGMPACTVVGVEIWDSAGTPLRWAYITGSSVVVASTDTYKIAAGSLTLDPTP